MSDLSDASAAFLASDAAPADDPAPVDTPPPAVEAPESSPAGADDAADTPSDGPVGDAPRDPVPWGEHKKARDEAARYRTELRAYEEAFSGWAPDDAAALMHAVKVSGHLIAQGKTGEAAAVYAQIAKVLGPEAAEAVQDAVDDADDSGDELMSKAEVARMLEERDSTREYERGVEKEMQRILKAADELGYDPESEDWARVLSEALSFHDGDVHAAAEADKARQQAIIDKYLEGKADTARKTPRVASGSNPAPAGAEPPGTIGEASDQLRAFLDQAV